MVLSTGQAAADGNKHDSTVRESTNIADHHIFNTDIEVDEATTIVRDFKDRVITANITTGALEAEFAYSICFEVRQIRTGRFLK